MGPRQLDCYQKARDGNFDVYDQIFNYRSFENQIDFRLIDSSSLQRARNKQNTSQQIAYSPKEKLIGSTTEQPIFNSNATPEPIKLEQAIDYASMSWLAERKNINWIIFFNIELIAFNLALIVFSFQYYSYNEMTDGFMVLLFPFIKSLFIWINFEFIFRYFKTGQILKTFIHPDPMEQMKACEPSIVRCKKIVDITVLGIFLLLLIVSTILTAIGF